MRTIIDDTVGSRPVSIFRRVSSPHRHLFPAMGDFGCPRLIMRARGTAEKRRSSARVVLFPAIYIIFFFLFLFVFPLSAHFPRGFNFTLVNNDTK